MKGPPGKILFYAAAFAPALAVYLAVQRGWIPLVGAARISMGHGIVLNGIVVAKRRLSARRRGPVEDE